MGNICGSPPTLSVCKKEQKHALRLDSKDTQDINDDYIISYIPSTQVVVVDGMFVPTVDLPTFVHFLKGEVAKYLVKKE